MYKEDLALNNLHGLICHKTKPNQMNTSFYIYKKLVTKGSFSIATTPRCKGGCYSFCWIASLYP